MRAIVADTYGSGQLLDADGVTHELQGDTGRETDVRDTIVTGDGQEARVVYRADGRTVEVAPNTRYAVEYENDDVVDLRFAATAAQEIAEAMDGIGTDEERIYRALEQVAGQPEARSALEAAFRQQTGRSLRAALTDEMSGDELERALRYLR